MNYIPDLFAANSLVWPLVGFLMFLMVMRQARDDVQPIVRGIVGSLAAQSNKYALVWTVALMTAALASMQALQDVAQQMHWVIVAAFAKIAGPGLGVLVAIGNRLQVPNGNGSPPPPSTTSTPPFPIAKP